MIGSICDCTSDETLTVYTNGGSKNFTQIAPFMILPTEVHFNSESIININVIKDVASIPGVHISMYPRKKRASIVEY